jgi:hypothetical protein
MDGIWSKLVGIDFGMPHPLGSSHELSSPLLPAIELIDPDGIWSKLVGIDFGMPHPLGSSHELSSPLLPAIELIDPDTRGIVPGLAVGQCIFKPAELLLGAI